MEIETFKEEESLEERLKSFEKEKKGLINDLQAERKERQAMEARLAQMETSLNAAANDDGEVTNEIKLNMLSQDPDGYIRKLVREEVDPVREDVVNDRFSRRIEKATSWLAKQEKVDADELDDNNLVIKEIVRISRQHGMQSMDPIEGTKAAYKIYQQEQREREARESKREENISGQSTEHVRSSSRGGTATLSREQVARMEPAEFNRRYDEIKDLERRGLIK